MYRRHPTRLPHRHTAAELADATKCHGKHGCAAFYAQKNIVQPTSGRYAMAWEAWQARTGGFTRGRRGSVHGVAAVQQVQPHSAPPSWAPAPLSWCAGTAYARACVVINDDTACVACHLQGILTCSGRLPYRLLRPVFGFTFHETFVAAGLPPRRELYTPSYQASLGSAPCAVDLHGKGRATGHAGVRGG